MEKTKRKNVDYEGGAGEFSTAAARDEEKIAGEGGKNRVTTKFKNEDSEEAVGEGGKNRVMTKNEDSEEAAGEGGRERL
jgi:hypothetical protein